MNKIAKFAIGFYALMIALPLGTIYIVTNQPPGTDDRAEAALRRVLQDPWVREIHFFPDQQLVCGQVKHAKSEWGFTPFAYSDRLGLTVSNNWNKEATESINRRYGCEFLTLAYSERWKSLFWGGEPGYYTDFDYPLN
jgi:hypothetical protein